METYKIYKITVSGTITIQAADAGKALAKAREHYEDDINRLNFSWTEQTVFKEPEPEE